MELLETLVVEAQGGSMEAFNCIVERFQDMARAYAYGMINDVYLAEDIAQEAFLEAFLNLAKLREPAAFSSWFRRIIFKQFDRLTRGKRLASSPLEAAADVATNDQSPIEIAENNEFKACVHSAIAALAERERLVITLFYGTGYALKDIAAFLDIPVTTVKKRLYDGRQRLKEGLTDVMGDVLQAQRLASTATFPVKVQLLIAARLGDSATVREVLAHGPGLLNMKMQGGVTGYQQGLFIPPDITILHEATMHNRVDLVQLLFDYGVNCNACARSGMTPLHCAILYRCYETAALLLKHGAQVDLPLPNKLTPLHIAAMKEDIQLVRLLLTYRAIVDCKSSYERTPLHWAALKGHIETVKLLLTYGADPDAQDVTGRTPHDWALSRKHMEISTLL